MIELIVEEPIIEIHIMRSTRERHPAISDDYYVHLGEIDYGNG